MSEYSSLDDHELLVEAESFSVLPPSKLWIVLRDRYDQLLQAADAPDEEYIRDHEREQITEEGIK